MRILIAASLLGTLASGLEAQVGKTTMLDPNLATAAQLATVPHMTDAIAKAVIAKRPYLNMLQLHAVLQPAMGEGTKDAYTKLWLHINLNATTKEEILLIPGVGARMLREFEEYRPYSSLAHFHREIGKYVKEDELARLESYVFVPMPLNTASDEDFLTIPGFGPRMLREFKEYRPYNDMARFEREIGKYVDKNEVARLGRYVVIK